MTDVGPAAAAFKINDNCLTVVASNKALKINFRCEKERIVDIVTGFFQFFSAAIQQAETLIRLHEASFGFNVPRHKKRTNHGT